MSEWVIDHKKIKDPNARSKYGTEFAIDGEFFFLAMIHPYWMKKLRLGSRKIRRYFHQMNEAWKRGLIPKEDWMWRCRP
jgi:hypothetical protein